MGAAKGGAMLCYNDLMVDFEAYVSVKEAAQRLGVSPMRVRQYITEGRLPAVKCATASGWSAKVDCKTSSPCRPAGRRSPSDSLTAIVPCYSKSTLEIKRPGGVRPPPGPTTRKVYSSHGTNPHFSTSSLPKSTTIDVRRARDALCRDPDAARLAPDQRERSVRGRVRVGVKNIRRWLRYQAEQAADGGPEHDTRRNF